MKGAGRTTRLALLGAVTVLPWLPSASATERGSSRAALAGATVESVIALARRLSPELVAAAFDADAARQAVGAAGAQPDPSVKFEAWGANAQRGIGERRFGVQQELKLWGKTDLERAIATAEADGASHKARAVTADLIARVKMVHAEYQAAYEALDLSRQLRRRVDELLGLLQSRYGATAVDQQDVIKGRIEAATAEVDVIRREGEVKSIAARLNALIGRPPLAPFDQPAGFRRLKPSLTLAGAQARARGANPVLAATASEVGAAKGAKTLKDLNYYPNVTLGALYVQRPGGGADTGEFLLGFKVPLQYAAKDAEQQAAASRLGGAHARNDAARLRLDGDVAAIWFGLEAARKAIRTLDARQLPPARESVAVARNGFSAGSTDLALVLEAERRLLTIHLELLKLKVEEQTRYAELERMAGGTL
ncbi:MULTISPECIES: TolC family protein [Bosea]|uniref:Transporter n=1 Tax=Bosea vaviloviae TaxID=1526658 RepID=A0A0N0M9D4_9HYPH|nr:TolC family protein [Bosea vaviloviae]KPH77819.1 transporter [Bosea vaviloviae]